MLQMRKPLTLLQSALHRIFKEIKAMVLPETNEVESDCGEHSIRDPSNDSERVWEFSFEG